MIQLKPIIDGNESIMLTDNSIEEAGKSCRHRFGKRFQGFASIPTEIKARSKWEQYRAKQVSRAELEDWLTGLEDEAEIRAIFNQMRG